MWMLFHKGFQPIVIAFCRWQAPSISHTFEKKNTSQELAWIMIKKLEAYPMKNSWVEEHYESFFLLQKIDNKLTICLNCVWRFYTIYLKLCQINKQGVSVKSNINMCVNKVNHNLVIDWKSQQIG